MKSNAARLALAALPFISGSASAAPTGKTTTTAAPADNSTTVCATGLHIIAARGSTEAPGPGVMGPMIEKVIAQLPGSDFVSVDYPALLSGTKYSASESNGTAAMTKLVLDYAAACPDSKMALLGYSQGAQVAGDVVCGTDEGEDDLVSFPSTDPLPADIASKIAAVVLLGDPSHNSTASFNVGDGTHDGLFPRHDLSKCGDVVDRMASFCHAEDPFCDQGLLVSVHLNYIEKDSDDIIKFILSKA